MESGGGGAAKRRVMIAVDDSEVSAYAFAWGLRNLIRPATDHVVVLTAQPLDVADFPNLDVATEYGVAVTPAVAAAAPTPAGNPSKVLVNKFLELLSQSNVSAEGDVVKGDAGSWITDEGARLAADVIVVGSHASGVVKRTLLGSVSDYVLRNAPCTVAVVRQAEEALAVHDPLASSGGPRKIVIAVDETEEAIGAFTWALKNFCRARDHVVLYHVHQPYVAPITGVVGTGELGMEEVYPPPESAVKDEVASLMDSQKVVEKFMEYADKQSEIKCEGMVVSGETQAKVIEGLNALKADAVILGTHERSAVARTFLGSVSDYLAHNSPCPFIVFKSVKGSAAEPHSHAG